MFFNSKIPEDAKSIIEFCSHLCSLGDNFDKINKACKIMYSEDEYYFHGLYLVIKPKLLPDFRFDIHSCRDKDKTFLIIVSGFNDYAGFSLSYLQNGSGYAEAKDYIRFTKTRKAIKLVKELLKFDSIRAVPRIY